MSYLDHRAVYQKYYTVFKKLFIDNKTDFRAINT